jgi:hypothetical protein
VIRHRDIQDPDCGRFTVKVYHSDRALTADGWRHSRIILKPDTRATGYSEMVLEDEEGAELTVLGEYVASLAC